MPSSTESKYRLIFENAPVGIVYFSAKGILTDCNEQFVEILGSVRSRLLGIDMTSLPDKKISQSVKRALAGETGFYEGHYRSITSGKVIPVKVTFAGILSEEDAVEGGIGIVEDITQHVEMNRTLTKFRLGINRSSNPIYITDQDGFIQYVNPAFEKQYGFKESEVIGKTPRILKSGKQSNKFYDDFWETILSGESAEGEIVNKTKSGDLLNIHYSTNPIIDSDGQHIGYIAIQDNISERAKMEDQIRKSLKEKNVMLAEIHHRVKNNLAIVSGLLELEALENEDQQTRDFVRKSQTRIKSMAIVHEKLYKNESLSDINLREYMEDLVETIHKNWVSDDTAIQFDLKIDPLEININQAIPLSLIIHELVTNAIRHAFYSRKMGCIFIEIHELEDQIHCTISDNGDSMPDDYDVESSMRLGLSLVQILVQQLEGSVKFKTSGGLTCHLSFDKNSKKGPSSNWMSL